MPIASESLAHLGAVLQAIGRLIRADVEVNEDAVRTLLLAADHDPSPDALREVLHWAELLRTLKWQPSVALRDAAAETLTLRGLPPALVNTVLHSLATTSAQPDSTHPQGAAGTTRRIGTDADGMGREGGGSRTISRATLALLPGGVLPWASGAIRNGLPLILLLGLILRIWLATTQSAWLDEAWSLQKMARIPLAALYNATKSYDTKPPLYYAVLHVWLWLTGFGVMQARLLSVAVGVATIAVLYLLTDAMFDKATALCAATLLAISPIAIWYSDEIRMYAASGLFGLLAVYLLLRATREHHRLWWTLYAVCAVLCIYFDLSGGPLPLAANLAVAVLVLRRTVPLWPWLVSNAVVVLLAIPALLLFRFQMADHGSAILYGAPTVRDVWLSILDLTSLNADRLWAGLTLVALTSSGIVACFHGDRDRSRRQVYVLLALLIATPLLVPLALSLIHPLFVTRTVQTAVFGLLILFARGIVSLPRARIPGGALAFAAIATLNATSLYAAATSTLKEDWEGLAHFADRRITSDSLILIDPFWLLDPYNLYWQPYRRQVAQHEYPPIETQTLARQTFRHYSSVWLVAYYIDSGDHLPIDQGTMFLRAHYRLASTSLFYGISLSHFVAPSDTARAGTTATPVRVAATPDRVQDGSSTLVQVHASPGAICTLRIVYATNPAATGWFGAEQPADSNGEVAWRVQVKTDANAGTAIASCTRTDHVTHGIAHLFVEHQRASVPRRMWYR